MIKVAKPRQDPRFDLPTLGLGTFEAIAQAKVRALAYEAGCTIVLDREELVNRADSQGVALVGFGPEGPTRGGEN